MPSIGDDDTIRVRQAGKAVTVRLACRDACEMAQAPYGHRLAITTTDRCGHTVAQVISNTNINLALVEAGHAFAYRQVLRSFDATTCLDAEQRAKSARPRVWPVLGGITGPQDHRHSLKSPSMRVGSTSGGRRYRCAEINSYDRTQELLRQGQNSITTMMVKPVKHFVTVNSAYAI